MLHFFRRYQKFIFIFITVIIVISFVFFGTYQAVFPSFSKKDDLIITKTADGKKISHSLLQRMVFFLNQEVWMNPRSLLDGSFLNDNVITKDFLQTNFATVIATKYRNLFEEELLQKRVREKSYQPYIHPINKNLTAASIWNLFSPQLLDKLKMMQQGDDPLEQRHFQARVDLILAEMQCPPGLLTYMLRYHEKEYTNLPTDPLLMKEDISLFGYRNFEDWFGTQFMNVVAETIFQFAALARQQGYEVSDEEVMAELISKANLAYETFQGRLPQSIENGRGLLLFSMKRLGLNEREILNLWKEITLFRRFFEDVGSSSLIDYLPVKQMHDFAYERASLDIYQMPKELRLQSFEELVSFETYLNAVCLKRTNILDIPLEHASFEEIKKKAPQLIGEHYELQIGEISHQKLLSLVTLKEMWEWQTKNWNVLQKQFPELVQKNGTPFDILESLESKFRKTVDTYSKKQILHEHPEWVDHALQEAPFISKKVFLNNKIKSPLPGIRDLKAFQLTLDSQEVIVKYSQDEEHFYKIQVTKKGDAELLSFKEAVQLNVLSDLETKLEGNATAQRVVLELAKIYRKESLSEEEKNILLPAYRFGYFLSFYLNETPPETSFASQWRIEKRNLTITRAEPAFFSADAVFSQAVGFQSGVEISGQEGVFCYKILDKKKDVNIAMNKLDQAQTLLSLETKRACFEKLLPNVEKYFSFQIQ